MNALLQQRLARSMAIGLLLIAPLGCTVTGGGLAYDGTVGVGLDYYEPSGFDYGGWGPGYGVGPYRDGGHRPDGGRGMSPGNTFRPAPSSHSIPSIPSRARPGGGRSGGGGRR
jgi:hypothetical protein